MNESHANYFMSCLTVVFVKNVQKYLNNLIEKEEF